MPDSAAAATVRAVQLLLVPTVGTAGGWGLVVVAAAGVAAGLINAVVGSGSLFTFPTLLALGVPSVTANVSNNIGLVPGNVAAAWGYRAELTGQRRRTATLVPASLLGSVVGAGLLLVLPARAFSAVVPVLIALSVVLVVLQPRLQAALRRRSAAAADARAAAAEVAAAAGAAAEVAGAADGPAADADTTDAAAPDRPPRAPTAAGPAAVSPLLVAGVFVAGVYGGYFGAAQGVLLLGLLGSLVVETLQRLNGVKNVLALVVNATAAGVFAVFASSRIAWPVVVAIAVGSTVGGLLGARVGRRLSPTVLRVVIACVGIAAIVRLLA